MNARLTERAHPVPLNQSPQDLPVNGAAELTVIVPTFNESGNVAELVRRLHIALSGLQWEVVFVDDDSPDGTSDAARSLALQDPHVRCLQRIGRRGLSSACVEGVMASSAPFVAVIDGDLQHDETLLPVMLASMKRENVDVVVGSRYVSGGGMGTFAEHRVSMSRLATRLSRLLIPASLQDPMSGFFMTRREVFVGSVRQLSGMGFKLLLDLFASSSRPLRFIEVPYTFRERVAGESKLDNQVAWDYLMLLMDKLVGHIVPVRFIGFALVGGIGVAVHMSVLATVLAVGGVAFTGAQTIATLVAMTFNFALNNLLTYRDKRLRGLRWLSGLASFMALCSIGALANVGVARFVFENDGRWALAALAGILIGVVWNYAVTSLYTWGPSSRRKGRPRRQNHESVAFVAARLDEPHA